MQGLVYATLCDGPHPQVVYKPLATIDHLRPTWTLAQSRTELHDTAMFSRVPRPLNNSQTSPHPHEVVRVLNTITEIVAASTEINRKDKVTRLRHAIEHISFC